MTNPTYTPPVDLDDDMVRELADRLGAPIEAVRHTVRFRKVSTRYPRRVNEAYEWDTERAMADSDDQVAVTVASWERAQGLTPRDWPAIGADERGDDVSGRP